MAVTMPSRRFGFVSLVVMSLVSFGCTESRTTPQQVSARLDHIDVLIAKKEWEAARAELRTMLEDDIYRLSGSARTDAEIRLTAQGQLIVAGMVDESRAALERTHISVADLFARFDDNEVRANREWAGKEVHVKGEVGMIAIDKFDRPYITLHSSAAPFSAQAFFPYRDRLRHLELGQAVFVTCNCDGKFGNVIVLTRCSMAFPSANGFIPTDRSRGREGIRKCRDGTRECA